MRRRSRTQTPRSAGPGLTLILFALTTALLAGSEHSEQLPLKRPGAKASGKVLISVPKNATLKTVRYEAGVLGPPLEVRAARHASRGAVL